MSKGATRWRTGWVLGGMAVFFWLLFLLLQERMEHWFHVPFIVSILMGVSLNLRDFVWDHTVLGSTYMRNCFAVAAISAGILIVSILIGKGAITGVFAVNGLLSYLLFGAWLIFMIVRESLVIPMIYQLIERKVSTSAGAVFVTILCVMADLGVFRLIERILPYYVVIAEGGLSIERFPVSDAITSAQISLSIAGIPWCLAVIVIFYMRYGRKRDSMVLAQSVTK